MDSCIEPYVQGFLNNSVGGAQILGFGPDDLEHLGITKIGHQEIILEGIDHLRNIHYELDRENLQLLAMRLSCLSHSLHNELCQSHLDTERLSTQILADISTIVAAVKPLIAWLDRPGFSGEAEYERCRKETLKHALRMATCGQRDRFVEAPVSEMKTASAQLAKLADSIVQDMSDPLILQPASLDLATIKKRASDDLGFYIVPSFRGVHKISDMKLNSAAHQSGKIEPGDEIIQINYQTVVGWSVKEVMSLFAESPNETLLTLKKRPRHTKVYGQIYVKPYRLPSKKRAIQAHSTEMFTRIHFRIPLHSLKIPIPSDKKKEAVRCGAGEDRGREETSSDEEVATVQHKLAVPSKPVHRRATITGASPLSKRPPFDIHELWHEMKLEKESCTKQSTTSVVDFEERLSSVGKELEPASSESALETLTIKQKIEMFSRESDKNDRKKTPPQPVKPQIRINSEPIFDMKAVNDANKINEKQLTIKASDIPFTDNKKNADFSSDRKVLNESFLTDERKFTQEKYMKSEKFSNVSLEKNLKSDKFPLESQEKCQKSEKFKNIPQDMCLKSEKFSNNNFDNNNCDTEEHGKVVQTINRHLLMNKLSDDSDVHEYPCYKPKPSDCSSNSLPHHGRSRADNYERKMTHSLPTRGRAECDSELSRTISKVITEERERAAFDQNKVVTREPKQIVKTSQSIFYSKSYSSESLDKNCETRHNQEADLAYKYNSLEDRHLRREYDSAGELRSGGPPVPPPRPSLSKPSNACYRAAIIAARALGKASPKAQRKKHPLLSKGRNVSVKDFPSADCDGWLLQRCRKGSGTWNRRWCLIHSNTLYTFASREATKAETLVCLPGFTTAPAEEVKSRPFAFKVYHTGTMFYFAAETNFELSVWLDAITTSTLGPNPNAQAVVYSESEGEDLPVRKAPTPAPRPPPSGSGETGSRMFGSLKKLSGGSSSGSGGGSGSSLDRKCLRSILGSGPVPVPTAQYRSYRRVHNAPLPPVSNSREQSSEPDPPPADMGDYRLTSRSTPPVPRRRTVIREPENWNSPARPSPSHDERIRRPEHMHLTGSGQVPQTSREGMEPNPDCFSKPPQSRKKIKTKKPHIGGGIRGVFPSQPLNRQPVRSPHQEGMLSHHPVGDYPGLEYPPVFEPGTYTLDTSLLMSRQHQPPS